MLAHVEFRKSDARSDARELSELATSAGLLPQAHLHFRRRIPHPRLYFGTGQAEQLRESCEAHDVQLAVIGADLTPAQERNLEQQLQCRVLGRTGLILDIFAQRARSHEGKLQVEVAQLNYFSTRLVRGWSHLERQKGGIGLRGPGEKQLELDRRLLLGRLRTLRRRLTRLAQQRDRSRSRRRRDQVPQVALVGHTNVGKSTLCACLTGQQMYAADQWFATLDPTCRRMHLADGPEAVVSDTVGFIRRLPTELIEAFHSTLETVRESDLLLHVIDGSDPAHQEQAAHVRSVLAEIGAGEVPVIEVYNKADLARPAPDDPRLWVSAHTGAGMAALGARIVAHLRAGEERLLLRLPQGTGAVRAELYRTGRVLREVFSTEGDCEMELWLPAAQAGRFARFRVDGGAAPDVLPYAGS